MAESCLPESPRTPTEQIMPSSGPKTCPAAPQPPRLLERSAALAPAALALALRPQPPPGPAGDVPSYSTRLPCVLDYPQTFPRR